MNKHEFVKSVETLLDGHTIIYPKDKFLMAVDKLADLLMESDENAIVKVSTKRTSSDPRPHDIVVSVKTYLFNVTDISTFRKLTEYFDSIEILQGEANRDKIDVMFTFKDIFKY